MPFLFELPDLKAYPPERKTEKVLKEKEVSIIIDGFSPICKRQVEFSDLASSRPDYKRPASLNNIRHTLLNILQAEKSSISGRIKSAGNMNDFIFGTIPEGKTGDSGQILDMPTVDYIIAH